MIVSHIVDIRKAHSRQLRSIPIAVSGTGHTWNLISALDAVIHMQVLLKNGS